MCLPGTVTREAENEARQNHNPWPKDRRYVIVEFKTADGVALAFSVPKGSGTAVLEHFQDKMPYGLAVPDVRRTLSPGFYWLEPRGGSSIK